MNKYIKKKDLIKQLESLHESLEAYKNLGMVYAREQEELAADGDVDIDNQPIVERSEQIVSEILQMQKEMLFVLIQVHKVLMELTGLHMALKMKLALMVNTLQ